MQIDDNQRESSENQGESMTKHENHRKPKKSNVDQRESMPIDDNKANQTNIIDNPRKSIRIQKKY